MKSIAIFYDFFYPAYKAGGPITAIANLIHNTNPSYQYHIICSNTEYGSKEPLENVIPDKWCNFQGEASIYYITYNKITIKKIRQLLREVNPEIVIVNGPYSPYFSMVPLIFSRTRTILSVIGALHPGALSQKSFKKTIFLHIFKLLNLHKCCDFHATDEKEKKYIQNIFGKNVNIYVAQNFPRIFSIQSVPDKKAGRLQLISIALISPMKNHLLVLKALMKCDASICYDIYGPIKDESYWKLCKEIIARLPININVNYKGNLAPDLVEQTLGENHVFIVPSKSENFGHAFYEALSSGRPVITSYNTPWKDLRSSLAGINVSLENPGELVNAINHFAAMDKNEFVKWSIGARQYSAHSINIDSIKQQYQEMFLS